MKIFGYHDSDGLLQFEAQYPDDVDPPEMSGLLATEMEATAGPPPFNGARYNIRTMEWVDARTMEDRKSEKWREIKAARDNAEFGGFDWDGSRFDSDQKSQSRIQGAVQMAAIVPGFAVDWTLADNTVRELTSADLIGVAGSLATHVSAQHAIARSLRQQIDAAESLGQLQAITWPTS